MPTQIVELEAIRGTEFSEIVTLADNLGAPISMNNAQALFILRQYERGPIILQKDNTDGISFGTSNLEISLTESELDSISYNKIWYDLFVHISGDVKKKIARGTFVIE